MVRQYVKGSRVVLHSELVLLGTGVIPPQYRSSSGVDDVHLVLSLLESGHGVIPSAVHLAHLKECRSQSDSSIAQLRIVLGVEQILDVAVDLEGAAVVLPAPVNVAHVVVRAGCTHGVPQ